jgi:hypothetical protein
MRSRFDNPGLTIHRFVARVVISQKSTCNFKRMFVSAACFNLYAVRYFTNKDISWAFDKPSRLSSRKFKSLFLYNVKEVVKLWDALCNRRGTLPFNRPEQLLWTLYYLKVYPTWDQMAMTTGITEKTLRKWVAIVVEYLANIDDWVRTNLSTCW